MRDRHRRIASVGLGAALLTALLLSGALVPAAGARRAGPADTTQALAITATNYITEQGRLTVSIQLASTANVTDVGFTFCRMSNSVCYNPILMKPEASNWYVGSSNPMTDYDGMTVGISAGFNITVNYADNSTQNWPSLPNQFPNLTLSQLLGFDPPENVYVITVENQLYDVSGTITNATTGQPVAGANVSLTPSNATPTITSSSGAYAFSSIANGSYTLTVKDPGYPTFTQAVSVSGQDATDNVHLAATGSGSTGTGTGTPSKSSSSPGFLDTSTGHLVLGGGLAAAVIVVVAVVLLVLRPSRPPRQGEPATTDETPERAS